MRIGMVAAALAVGAAVAGCSSSTEASPTSTAATPTTTTTRSVSAAAAELGQFYEEWQKKFEALQKPEAAPCAPQQVRSKVCADYLTPIVETTTELEQAIRARPDSDRYVKTLVEVEKITRASERYAEMKCYAGAGTVDSCHAQAIAIGIGSVSLTTRLMADDLTR